MIALVECIEQFDGADDFQPIAAPRAARHAIQGNLR